MGMTGSGKTQGACFLLSRMNFEQVPWIILDFKSEAMFNEFHSFPLLNLEPPRDPGIYVLHVDADTMDIEEINFLLRKIKSRGYCGIFVDEGMELGHSSAFRSVLGQGRSLQIPMIVCTQRPKLVTLSAFTEANFYMIYRLIEPDDLKLVAGRVGRTKPLETLPKYHFYWYDVVEAQLLKMRPVPERSKIISEIARRQDLLASRQKARIYL